MSQDKYAASLFGYSRRRVRKLLQDREAMAQDAEARLHAAEGRILELRRELATVEEELSDRDAKIQELSAEVEAFAHDPDRPTPNMLAEELNSILSSAQATAARMIERAKAVSDRHLDQATEYQQELYADLARMDEWRQEALPLIRDVQSRLGEIRSRLEEVAETVVETVKPLEQLSDIDRPEIEAVSSTVTEDSGVKRLRPTEQEGGRGRSRQRSSRSKQAGDESASDVIEIPDRAKAR
jgi:DNA repair exonuclease SbcCD ATPase subunit